jgi:hypothetical protein
VHRSTLAIGRRRLDALLFARRTLADIADDDAGAPAGLRGFIAFPSLALTLERIRRRPRRS